MNHFFHYKCFCFRITASIAAKFSHGQLARLAVGGPATNTVPLIANDKEKKYTTEYSQSWPYISTQSPAFLGRNGTDYFLSIVPNLNRVKE
jgi:hypothetical protein